MSLLCRWGNRTAWSKPGRAASVRLLPLAVAVVAVMAQAALPDGGTADEVPSPEEIVHRVMMASATAPDELSADAVFKLRIKKPVTEPPDCVFTGTLRLARGRQILRIGNRTAGSVCWAASRYVIGRLFEASEPVGSFLSRFDLHVLGEKLEGNDNYYLVQGKARDPKNNPNAVIAWVDYDRGLVTEGTLRYPWGTIDVEQQYTPINGAWILTYQFLHTARFDASLEGSYSNFR